MAIDLYWGSGSPYSWRVLLALEYKRLTYTSHLLQFSKQEHKSPQMLAMNPRGRLPVLRDGDYVCFESLAILRRPCWISITHWACCARRWGRWCRRTRLCLSGNGMRDLRCGLLDESFGCGGPTLAGELGQSQLSDVLQRTRVQWELFDYNNRARTVSNPNPAQVTAMFQRYSFRTNQASATLPCYGLSVDALAVCLRFGHGKGYRMRVLRGGKRER